VNWHPVVLALYEARLGSRAAAEQFLAGGALPAPPALPRLAELTERIECALERGERIGVFGHDDPDGITSAAVLTEALEELGGLVDPYVPDRNVEGHGLYPELVRGFRERGATLLVTTDGCSANFDEVALAASIGLDVWVTDHHEIAEGRPTPPHLVNPKADPDTSRLLGALTGAGVAALVARDLLARAGRSDAVSRRGFDLVALGTIADYGDLGAVNRRFVVDGLTAVARGDRPAIEEVREALDLSDDDVLRTVSMRRLAAVFASVPSDHGRSRGFDALLGRRTRAADVRALLDAFVAAEAERDDVVVRACAEAKRIGAFSGEPAVVVLDDATPRALGASATELVARTGRPAAVLWKGDRLIGELRGPEGVHLVDVLNGLRGSLESWGGHRQAAGFSADPKDTDGIARSLANAFRATIVPTPAEPRPAATLATSDLDEELLRSIRAAAPFGKGNEAPFFRVDGVTRSAEDLLAPVGERFVKKSRS
jgi:single-stranded-DNA-specific exonuclease